MPMEFAGRVVLVTGSSRGIGAGMARAFAARGARCVVNYVADADGRNRSDAESLAREIGAAMTVEADVADHAAVGKAMRAIVADLGRLDMVVNNAGILRDKTIRKMTPEDFNAVVAVNLGGAFNTTQHAATLLEPGGRIVNISSVSGFQGFFGQANYASSKAAIVALTKVAAREFARQRITVNAIAPGFIETDILKDMPEEAMRRFVEQIPLGRLGRVEDVVNAAVFLCSPLADYITGQVIHVNGGLSM
ncbi:MAG: 3-oxoacyl-ACP reductase FabG [Planctomycetia bacterium]|nr:3-oxoacyl-ACP reductase FabG [Planctomycetia bacterium]